MSARVEVAALSVAAFVSIVEALPHDTSAVVVALEGGAPWAAVEVAPCGDFARTAFPCFAGGLRGDTNRRGQAGARFRASEARHSLGVIVERSRRMVALEAVSA